MEIQHVHGYKVDWLGLEEVPNIHTLELRWYQIAYHEEAQVLQLLHYMTRVPLEFNSDFENLFVEIAKKYYDQEEDEVNYELVKLNRTLQLDGMYALDEADLAYLWIPVADYVASHLPSPCRLGPEELTIYVVGRILESLDNW